MRLRELIEPRKPANKIKSGVRSRYGMQGSTIKIADRSFTTEAGNLVTVSFKPSIENGEKSVEITFYVNGSMEDNASGNKDGKILPGVLYIILQYLKRSRVNHCSFSAAPGEGDYKKIYNLPKDQIVEVVKNCIEKLKNQIINIVVTPEMENDFLDRRNDLLTRIGKPPLDRVEYIQKQALVNALDKLSASISDISIKSLTDYVNFIESKSANVNLWPEYILLMDEISKLEKALRSHTTNGLSVHRNRRKDLYTKMVNHYFAAEWDIDINGTSFTLSRKDRKVLEALNTPTVDDEDYRGSHTAPDREQGSPLYDLTANYTLPADLYHASGLYHYGNGGPDDAEAYRVIKAYHNRPDAYVTVYRAVPDALKGLQRKITALEKQIKMYMSRGKLPSDAGLLKPHQWYEWATEELEKLQSLPIQPQPKYTINPGDWVSISKLYAISHGQGNLRNEYKIISKRVRAKDIFCVGDLTEWGYDPV